MNDKPEPREARKLQAVHFVESVALVEERTSMAIGTTCDSIQPACMLPDGMWAACDKGQRGDGLGIRRVRRGATDGKPVAVSVFVPWSNIKNITYGE